MKIANGLLFVAWVLMGVYHLTAKREGVSKLSYGCTWLCLVLQLALNL